MSDEIIDNKSESSEQHLKGLNIHSEQVQDIMGRPPGWLVRCGISIILLVIVLLLVGSAFVKYPEVLTASIKINAYNLPAQVKARSTGRIDTLFVREGDTVNAGVPLALIENPAKYEDVIFLKENMASVAHDSAWHCDRPLQLGEVQNSYLSYVQAVNALTFFVGNDYLGEMIASKRKQIDVMSKTLDNYKRQSRIGAEQLSVAKEKFAVDSTLFKKGVISKVNFSESRNVFLQQRMAYQSMLIETDNMRLNLLQAEQSVTELEQSRMEQRNDLSLQLEVARGQLEAGIRQWEQSYLLVSPARGTIALTMFWQRNQNITAGETMLAVVPVEPSSYFGKIYLSQQGAGKVKTGQNVNIKLDDYPYMEFGFVQVGLSKMSLMPYEDASAGNIYVMEVELPDSLVTQYGKFIPYRPEMSGTAEIITEDMSVLVRLINPIRAVLRR